MAVFLTIWSAALMVVVRLSTVDPILNRVLANHDASVPSVLRVYFILDSLGDEAVPWLLRCLVMMVIAVRFLLLHLNFVDDAVLVFA